MRRSITAFLLALAAPLALAQGYPTKPIRMIVAFPPGGLTDVASRLTAERLSARLGQPIVIDNRPGATGTIGSAAVSAADPDGYTLLGAFDGTMVVAPHVVAKPPFDTLRDFAHIGKIGDADLIFVAHPGAGIRTVADLIAQSKSRPGGLSYGTTGIGGTTHVGAEILRQRTGGNLVHIPYKGGAQATADVVAGNIPMIYTSVAAAVPFVRSGKLHPIAVTGLKRSSSLPEVPTIAESGVPGFEVASWVGLMAPAKTPKAIVDRLNAELNAVLGEPELREKLATAGIAATPGSPAEFTAFLERALKSYGDAVKAAGIKAE